MFAANGQRHAAISPEWQHGQGSH